MSQKYDFYTARAAEADAEADKAKLQNAKDRANRSAKAWRQLASREQAVQAKRIATAEAKEDARAEERAAAEERATAEAARSDLAPAHSWG